MVESRIGKEIGNIVLRGKVDSVADTYSNIKYATVAEQDLNTIINCLSTTKYGKELADACRGKKILINISLETDPYT